MQQKKAGRHIGRFLIFLFLLIIIIFIVYTLFNRRYPLRYTDIIYECAIEYELEPELICAVIHAESKFNEDAVSRVGAGGLMQIMEPTAYWLAPQIGLDDFHYDQIFEPEINIRLGSYYLYLLKRQYGDLTAALCAYNAGSGNVDRWLSDTEYSTDGKTLDRIPFLETDNYVNRVSENQKIYEIILRVYELLNR